MSQSLSQPIQQIKMFSIASRKIRTLLIFIPVEQEVLRIPTAIFGVSFAGTLLVGVIVGFIMGLITGINAKRRHQSNTTSPADVVAASKVEDPTAYPEYEEIDLKTCGIKSSQNVAYGVSLR